MLVLPLALSLLGLGGMATGLSGQEGQFAFEIRGGAAFPLSSLRTGEGGWAGETGPGTSFGMGFTLPAPGPFGSFLGFGQRRFRCEGPLCARGSEWVSTGFDVALRLVVGDRRFRPWLRGGFHNHRLVGEVLGEGDLAAEIRSDGGGGFEFGGGLLVAIGERTSLSPGIQYGWGEVPFPDRPALHLRYLVAEMGLVLGF